MEELLRDTTENRFVTVEDKPDSLNIKDNLIKLGLLLKKVLILN